jgi:hypothetical protein
MQRFQNFRKSDSFPDYQSWDLGSRDIPGLDGISPYFSYFFSIAILFHCLKLKSRDSLGIKFELLVMLVFNLDNLIMTQNGIIAEGRKNLENR